MPNAYEFGYGEVTFAEPDGTPIFSTTDLGLWTSVDEEPSPDPKWVRVSVPGADGAVDLSRALAGQVTYEQREVRLRFEGQRDTHAEALALVHRMRRALHGARVRMTTMLSAQIGGWYVADCECDGTADADGGVTIDVTAVADPFIRVGNQTLTLPSTGSEHSPYYDSIIEVGSLTPTIVNTIIERYTRGGSGQSDMVNYQPPGASGGTLWCAMNDNLFDIMAWPMATRQSGGTNPMRVSRALDSIQFMRPTGGAASATAQVMASDLSGEWPYYPFGFPFTHSGTNTYGDALLPVTLDVWVHGVSNHGAMSVEVEAVLDGNARGTDGFVTGDVTVSDMWEYDGALDSVPMQLALSIDLGPTNGKVLSAINVTASVAVGAVANVYVGMRPSSEAAPAMFVTPDVRQVAWTAGGPFGRAEENGIRASDWVNITPVETLVTKWTEQTALPNQSTVLAESYERRGTSEGMVPDGTRWLASTIAATGGPYPTTLGYTARERGTVTGDNLTMRATPTLTSDFGGEVTIDGRTAQAPSGTVELGALTVPGGEFEVAYLPYAGEGMTLTWEGGAL